MAAATIFDCWISEILIADAVWRSRPIIVSNFVKNCRSVTEILRFLKFWRLPPPPSSIFEIAKFYWLLGWRGSRRISMPYYVKIGQAVPNTLRFFDFSRWQPPFIFNNCWICKILLAGGVRRGNTHHCTKFRQNRFLLRRYCHFSNFQDGRRRRHLGFFISRKFIVYLDPEGRGTSSCQILSKLVNRLRRY